MRSNESPGYPYNSAENQWFLKEFVSQLNGEGNWHWNEGRFDESIRCYTIAIERLHSQEEQYKDPYDFAMSYFYLAEANRAKGELHLRDHYYAMIKLCIDQCNVAGINYRTSGNFAAAITSHQNALKILDTTWPGNVHDRATIYAHLAQTSKAQENFQYYASIRLFIEQCNKDGIISRENGDFIAAIAFHEQALTAAIQNNLLDLALILYKFLSTNYRSLAEFHVVNERFALAADCHNRILQIYSLLSPQTYEPGMVSELSATLNKIRELNMQMGLSITHSSKVEASITSELIQEVEDRTVIAGTMHELIQEVEDRTVIADVMHELIQEVEDRAVIADVMHELIQEVEDRTVIAGTMRELIQEVEDRTVIAGAMHELIQEVEDRAVIADVMHELIQEVEDRAVIADVMHELIQEVEDNGQPIVSTLQLQSDKTSASVASEKAKTSKTKKKKKKTTSKPEEDSQESENILQASAKKDEIKTLNELAEEYLKANRFEEAIASFKKGLELNKALYPDGIHADIAYSSLYLGNAYLAKGDLENSISFYRKAFIVFELYHQNEAHADIMIASDKISFVYLKQHKFDEAVKYLSKIFAAQKALYETIIQPEISTLFKTIKYIYVAHNDMENGFISSIRALQIISQFPDHHLRKDIENEMAFLAVQIAMCYNLRPEILLKVISYTT